MKMEWGTESKYHGVRTIPDLVEMLSRIMADKKTGAVTVNLVRGEFDKDLGVETILRSD